MREFLKTCDWKTFFRGLCWFVATFGLMKVSRGMFAAVFPLLAIAALSKKQHDFLLLLMFVTMAVFIGNTNLVTNSTVSKLALNASFAVVALAMAGRIAAGLSNRFVTPFLGIIPYLAWEATVSASGWSPLVSYLKLVLFSSIYIALYGAASSAASAGPVAGERQRAIILSGVAFMLIGSAMLIPFPAIGMMNPEDFLYGKIDPQYVVSLFKGMTSNSQCLGPVVAVLVTLVFCDMVFTVRRWRFFHLMTIAVGLVLSYKTSSRTAMGSLLVGLGMASWLFMRSKGVGQRWKGKVLSVMSLAALLFVCMVLCVPAFQDRAMRFLLKTSSVMSVEDVSFERMTVSRQGLVDFAMYNFRKKPLTGNGFQVSEDMAYVTRSSLKDYLSAPVEKGVWTVAVLEEGGIVGFILFAGFLVIAFFTLVLRKAYAAASVLFTMAVANMGEFTFFSMSYAGGMEWLSVFCAAVLDAHRERARWMVG